MGPDGQGNGVGRTRQWDRADWLRAAKAMGPGGQANGIAPLASGRAHLAFFSSSSPRAIDPESMHPSSTVTPGEDPESMHPSSTVTPGEDPGSMHPSSAVTPGEDPGSILNG